MIVITGGAGFIGSCLIAALNIRGRNDIIISDALGENNKWINLVGKSYCDFIDRDYFRELINTDQFDSSFIEAIVHLGACSRTTEKNADYLMDNNTIYTRELAVYAMNRSIPFYYASSAATYGDGKTGYNDSIEALDSLRPKNMYGYSKHLFDLWAKENGWFDKITGFKFFNVFGPNEYHKTGMTSAVYNAFNQIQETGRMRLFASDHPDYADGEQLRDFVYVKDVVDILCWFIENPGHSGLFNIGRGEPVSWNRITNAVFKAMNKTSTIEYIPMSDNLKGKYQYYTCANLEKLKSVCPLKFSSIEDSVKDYVAEYLAKDFRVF